MSTYCSEEQMTKCFRGLIRNAMHILIICTMTVQRLTKTDVHAMTAFPDVFRMLQHMHFYSAGDPINPDEGNVSFLLVTLPFIHNLLLNTGVFST